MEERRVDLVRLPREEQVFEREDIFGRDASNVFPTEFKKQQQSEMDSMKEALGAKKFISETELLELKTQGVDEAAGDGAPNRPLVEILRERKEAKEAEFQAQWKLMKQGKNKPLDEDDIEFLDNHLKADLERLQQQQEEERVELQGFRQAREAAITAPSTSTIGNNADGTSPANILTAKRPSIIQVPKKPAAKPVLRAVVKAKPKAATNTSEPHPKRLCTDAPNVSPPPAVSTVVPVSPSQQQQHTLQRDWTQARQNGNECRIETGLAVKAGPIAIDKSGGKGDKEVEEDDDKQPVLASLLGGYSSSGEDN